MTKFKGTLVLRNNISQAWKKWVHALAAQAKLRSQISRPVDNSFPVFAPLVWHAGHADGEATWFDMPGMPGKKLA